jgi:predicted enzyme related to lactoylglutathione lyase
MVGIDFGITTKPPDISPGSPCWVDVDTIDPAATQAFYAGLFGWEYQVCQGVPGRNGTYYTRALLDGQPIAGICAGRPGSRTSWLLYLAAPDVVWAAHRVLAHGGKVLSGAHNIAGQGCAFVVRDPTGGRLGLWEVPDEWRFDVGFPGSLAWAELNTRNGRIADRFFAELFGYDQRQVGNGRRFDYSVWSLGKENVLGRRPMGAQFAPDTEPNWMIYFAVDPAIGTDATARRAVALGGRVLLRPYDAAWGRTAVIEDIAGAIFSIVDTTPAEDDVNSDDD